MIFKKIVRCMITGVAVGIFMFAFSVLAKPNVYTVDYEFDCLPQVAEMEEKVVQETVLAQEVKQIKILKLSDLANLKLRDLVRSGVWSHTNSDGCTFKCRSDKYLYTYGGQYYWVGENLYRGVCSIENAYRLWRLSPAHYEVLRHYSDEQVLVGAEYKPGYCYYVLIKGQLYK